MTDRIEALKAALADRYEIEGEIGRGGMATVYLATDLRHDRRVAIKVLDAELASSIGGDRFVREIEISARLTHPRILTLIDSGQAGGLLYYVMPYIRGDSLRDRIQREKQLPVEDAFQITREVAEALEYAHGRGVVHRDVKPGNILLTPGGALVADFGIARALDEAGGDQLTSTGLAVGTPTYMSPEQGGEGTPVDGRADQYSLACVLYEMLAGHPPFAGATSQVIMARHASDPVPPLRGARPTVPEGAEEAVTRALAKVPADRFSTLPDFVDALDAPPTGEIPIGQPYRPARNRSRSWLIGSAVAAAFVALFFIIQGMIATGNSDTAGSTATELSVRRVVVLPFDNQTGDPALTALGQVAGETVADGIDEMGTVSVVPFATVLPMVQDPGARPIDVARSTEAGTLVSGRFNQLGEELQVVVELIDARDESRRRSIGPFVVDEAAPMPALNELRERVMSGVALELDVESYVDIRDPPLYDALLAYLEGGARLTDGDVDGMLEKFAEAMAIDSGFVEVRLDAAGLLMARSRRAESDSLRGWLNERKDRLAPSGQLRLEVQNVWLLETDQNRRYRDLVRLNESTGGDVENTLAQLALMMNRPGESIERLERTGALDDPSAPMWTRMVHAIALHRLGEHADELQVARANRESEAGGRLEAYWTHAEATALAALGEVDSVVAKLDEAASLPIDHGPPACTYWYVGMELVGHGHEEPGLRALERAVDWHETEPAAGVRVWCNSYTYPGEFEHARALYSVGRLSEAKAILDRLMADEPLDNVIHVYQGYLGRIAFHTQGPEAARRVMEEMETTAEDARMQMYFYGLAAISALIGDRDGAMENLRLALNAPDNEGEGVLSMHHLLHVDPDFESLRDYSEFVEFLRPLP